MVVHACTGSAVTEPPIIGKGRENGTWCVVGGGAACRGPPPQREGGEVWQVGCHHIGKSILPACSAGRGRIAWPWLHGVQVSCLQVVGRFFFGGVAQPGNRDKKSPPHAPQRNKSMPCTQRESAGENMVHGSRGGRSLSGGRGRGLSHPVAGSRGHIERPTMQAWRREAETEPHY